MSDRITRKDLDRACGVLNNRAGFRDTALWNRVTEPREDGTPVGRNVATVGMFYIDGAYSGWALYQVVSPSGGVRDVFRAGHTPARELYGRITAYMQAQEDAERVS